MVYKCIFLFWWLVIWSKGVHFKLCLNVKKSIILYRNSLTRFLLLVKAVLRDAFVVQLFSYFLENDQFFLLVFYEINVFLLCWTYLQLFNLLSPLLFLPHRVSVSSADSFHLPLEEIRSFLSFYWAYPWSHWWRILLMRWWLQVIAMFLLFTQFLECFRTILFIAREVHICCTSFDFGDIWYLEFFTSN